MKRTFKKSIAIICALTLIIAFAFTGCKSDDSEKKVQAVTEALFNSPNEKLLDLYVEMQNSAPVQLDEDGLYTYDSEALMREIKAVFGEYFSDKFYDKFATEISQYAFANSIAVGEDSEIIKGTATTKVKDFEITSTSDSTVHFKFTAECVNNKGEEKDIEITGQSQFDEDGLLSFYRLISGMKEFDVFFMDEVPPK